MELPKISYNDFNLEKVLGEVPKLRFKTTVRDINHSPGLNRLVHISRITFDIELHDAKDSSSSNEIGSLGTTNSVEPVTLSQGSPSASLSTLSDLIPVCMRFSLVLLLSISSSSHVTTLFESGMSGISHV
jgi:hypothetical protein